MRENGVSEVVKTEIRDGLAILTIDNPPVNALSTGVRRGLTQAIENVSNDSQVRAVVITCAGRTFISGADIREFDQSNRELHQTRDRRHSRSCPRWRS